MIWSCCPELWLISLSRDYTRSPSGTTWRPSPWIPRRTTPGSISGSPSGPKNPNPLIPPPSPFREEHKIILSSLFPPAAAHPGTTCSMPATPATSIFSRRNSLFDAASSTACKKKKKKIHALKVNGRAHRGSSSAGSARTLGHSYFAYFTLNVHMDGLRIGPNEVV